MIDTLEMIRADLDDLRDMEVEFDDDTCLSILAPVITPDGAITKSHTGAEVRSLGSMPSRCGRSAAVLIPPSRRGVGSRKV